MVLRYTLLISLIISFPALSKTLSQSVQSEWQYWKGEKKTFADVQRSINNGIKIIAETVLLLHGNLFSLSTFKTIAVTFPFYGVTRGFDEKIQQCFFDQHSRKNRNNPPGWCSQLARFSITPPIVYLGLQAVLSHNEEMRAAAQTFLIGLPFVLLTKDLIKQLEFKSNLRPFHETLSPHKRCSGGFPSGHMAEAVYTATLFGMRFGRRYAIPLSLIAGFLGTVFVACNRHYTSQVIAGAAFGAMYAVAANKVIDWRLDPNRPKKLQLGLTYESKRAGFSLAMNF